MLRALWTAAGKVATWVGVLVLVSSGVAGIYIIRRLQDDVPVTYADVTEHFKYGSTGGERGWKNQLGFGIPYWIWIALPSLFPEYLPDHRPERGYTSFGMIYEDGHDPRFDLPIGMSMRRVQGIDRVYFNCALCHTGSVRASADQPRQIVLGMPANTLDLGALSLFLDRSATSWKFRATRMLPKIDDLEAQRRARLHPPKHQAAPLSPIDRFVFNTVGIALMRENLLTLTSRLSFLDFASWGPGRVDTFNPPKALLGFPMERADPSELVGNADFPSVWNQQWKVGMRLHWDGNNTRVDERNLSAAFGTGATPATLDKASILRTALYLSKVAEPPGFPVAYLDSARAARGASIYQRYCWLCHGSGRPPFHVPGDGSLVGMVTPIERIGTDRSRLDSYTTALAKAQNSLYAGFPADVDYCQEHQDDLDRCYPARFSHFRKTGGYANLPLDGLWLRAPYFHNGSVPDLRSLLEPPNARPKVFYRGYDVYNYARVGFVSQGREAEQSGWRFDTGRRGNGNGGHVYGTTLSAAEKAALLEYLKTF